MKIRVGFVSNSSSSSFVVLGRDASIDEIDDSHVMFYGYRGIEGTHYFKLTPKMIEYVKDHYDDIDGKLLYEYASFGEEEMIKKSRLIEIISQIKDENVYIFAFDKDHWDIETFDEFIQNYGED